MNLKILISKTACFYYWVLILSGWDTDYIDSLTYHHYATDDILGRHSTELTRVKNILQSSKNPRQVLAELYSGNLVSVEAKTIAGITKNLELDFEDVWRKNLPQLKQWQDKLKLTDFSQISFRMQEIGDFFNSDQDLGNPYILYLVQNTPNYTPGGLTINNTNFMLVMPADIEQKKSYSNILSVIAHEYIHYIERRSPNSRELFRKSYDRYIRANNLPAPNRFKWKMMYVEAMVYCFSSKVIGGYLRPEIYDAPRPSLFEMKNYFNVRFQADNYVAEDVINWVALNILPEIEDYIKHNKTIDQCIADRIGELFSEFYLA